MKLLESQETESGGNSGESHITGTEGARPAQPTQSKLNLSGKRTEREYFRIMLCIILMVSREPVIVRSR